MTTVWILDHNVNDFKSLASRGKNLGTPPTDDRLLPGTPRRETWEDHYVWYDPAWPRKNTSIANFPNWSSAVGLVCDTEAKEVIRELIEDHVEFLPLAYYAGFEKKASDSKYSAINVLKILDCLDSKKTEFGRWPLKTIKKYVFKPHCIGETPIFKLPIHNRVTTYVTDEFKQLVEDHHLTGLEFHKVWEG